MIYSFLNIKCNVRTKKGLCLYIQAEFLLFLSLKAYSVKNANPYYSSCAATFFFHF